MLVEVNHAELFLQQPTSLLIGVVVEVYLGVMEDLAYYFTCHKLIRFLVSFLRLSNHNLPTVLFDTMCSESINYFGLTHFLGSSDIHSFTSTNTTSEVSNRRPRIRNPELSTLLGFLMYLLSPHQPSVLRLLSPEPNSTKGSLTMTLHKTTVSVLTGQHSV